MKLLGMGSLGVLWACVLALALAGGCAKAPPSYTMPSPTDPSAAVLFFLHGTITEREGPYASHPVYGPYAYDDILKTFADRGMTVVSEVRPAGTDKKTYAEKVVRQIGFLLKSGVPAENITVAGFSKGGAITLYVSVLLGNPRMNYVIMAGCGRRGAFGRNYQRFLNSSASSLRGRFLSIYDESDRISGTCKRCFDAAPVDAREIVLMTGRGHGVFYRPRKGWVDPVMEWINR